MFKFVSRLTYNTAIYEFELYPNRFVYISAIVDEEIDKIGFCLPDGSILWSDRSEHAGHRGIVIMWGSSSVDDALKMYNLFIKNYDGSY
jgi:hypothetical protein